MNELNSVNEKWSERRVPEFSRMVPVTLCDKWYSMVYTSVAFLLLFQVFADVIRRLAGGENGFIVPDLGRFLSGSLEHWLPLRTNPFPQTKSVTTRMSIIVQLGLRSSISATSATATVNSLDALNLTSFPLDPVSSASVVNIYRYYAVNRSDLWYWTRCDEIDNQIGLINIQNTHYNVTRCLRLFVFSAYLGQEQTHNGDF